MISSMVFMKGDCAKLNPTGNLMTGTQTDLIPLDFSKAFDKVSHLKLLYKLKMHGTDGNTLKWIQSFLVGRTQNVVLKGKSSEELSVTSGVPQVLELILFLLYINDFPENIQSQVHLFADDTAVYLAVAKQNNPQQLQDDLDQMQKWKKLWDMEFNPSKCVIMHTTRARHPINSQYTMHNQTLDTVDTARYLSVDISGNLNLNQ